jgi:hypothetical protein
VYGNLGWSDESEFLQAKEPIALAATRGKAAFYSPQSKHHTRDPRGVDRFGGRLVTSAPEFTLGQTGLGLCTHSN